MRERWRDAARLRRRQSAASYAGYAGKTAGCSAATACGGARHLKRGYAGKMIESEDVLGMGFYKKGTFTGSYKGLRYRIARDDSDADAGERFLVTAWHGPYCFDATPDKEKTSSFFPFTADGKEDAVAWLNAQWEARFGEAHNGEALPDDAR